MINIEALARENGIQTATEGTKHCRSGWIQFQCIYCRSGKWHLGFNISKGYFNCWHCGKKDLPTTIERMLNCTTREAWKALRKHSTDKEIIARNVPKHPLVRRKALRMPIGLGQLLPAHKQYLKNRGYNPSKLEYIWGLEGLGQQAESKYRWRIFIPVTFEDKLVSFQCRSISTNQVPPYLACDPDREARPIKDCLYGLDLVPDDTVVVVEGVADAWRLGPGAVATFGTSWVQAQVNLLKQFKKVYLLFDPEPDAQDSADKLGLALEGLGPSVEVIDLELDHDPGDLPQREAKALMKELGIS